MEKTHWKGIVSDPNYIGEADFTPGEEKVATIKSINQKETVTTAEGKSTKAVLHFMEKDLKPMILNVARSKAIEKVAGSPYFEDWSGVKIQLYIEHGIKAFGDIVNAVRVRPFKPRVQGAEIPSCADCKENIVAAWDKPAGYIAAYTKKKYGVYLCAECATKRKVSDEAQPSEAETEPDAIAEGAVEHEKPTGGDA